ncbi:galactoside 2-alpha-L-fucosyltransferase 2-like isoform X2 [Agrilus planipennis]|uniref:L-Fucosyltransferase n=1 Tax=Agrilus planipennis TaxID=224129 RepID=A0A1W4WCM2_AGRPL|nr:galactoside 2-alpha-L-fucosyltransferase 2-like isoform X2 [Agrilus planipennis]
MHRISTNFAEGYSSDERFQYSVDTEKFNDDINVVDSFGSCPDGNIITVGFGGQLGNRIWEYMSLYAAYQLYKDECRFYPYVPMEITKDMEVVFQKLWIPILQDLPEVCIQQREKIVIGGHDDIPVKELQGKNAVLELPKYSARYEFVSDYGFDNIRRELRFKPEYVNEVYTNLKSLKSTYYKENDDVVFVGMHYRGTDYVPHIRKYLHEKFEGPPTYEYYNKAMSFFQEKYEKVIFILVTIDTNWIDQNKAGFKKDANLAINPFESEKLKDLALLSHCNHSIISYGSFSSTAALFAGGTTFVYDLQIPLNVKGPILAMGLASRLPNWHVLK